MILEALADRLQAASVAFAGSDLFIGLMPDQPDKCMTLYEYQGQQPLEVLRDEGATLERPGVQVLVRAGRNDYPGAREFIVNARDVLASIADETISGVRFLRVSVSNGPFATGTDPNDRPLFSLNLAAVVER